MQADLLISLRMSLTVSLLVLIFISGVVAQNGWGVDYKDQSICALKGSTVTMRCTYTYPSDPVVLRTFWTKQWGQGSEPPDLLEDLEYRGRVQYLGDKQHDCTLRLRDVRETDQSKYYFRFLTDEPGGNYQGAGGVDLSVTDLQVEVPERVIEGDDVTLTCKTTCSLTVTPTFTWYRNEHRLSSNTDQLHLQPVSREDAGRYRCASQNLHSPEVTLNVRYGPKRVSVSISPSGDIVEGSSVTLTCSSDADPPVQNYTWFKGTSSVAKGETYTMKNISSVDSGEYKCRSSNEHGEKLSEALTLNVLWHPNIFLYIIIGIIVGTGGVFFILALLFIRRKRKCHSAGEPKPIQENLYSNMGTRPSVNNPADLANQDDGFYSTVELCGRINPIYGAEDEVPYGNIQHHRDQIVQMTQEAGVEYACVRFSHADPAHSSAALQSPSVIYSSVN
uniref:Ig-like domain-containing protein n=1 Tax=Pygocentrus nattereri TaxID=42514 RepID=A0AAR2LN71_PYGNA